MTEKIVFVSYSHKDEDWKNRLRPHLEVLEQVGLIRVWDDRQIDPGGDWYEEIRKAMSQAVVSICLISADYLASPFCTKEEVPYLLQRQAKEGMLLIAVLCRQCPWKAVPWLRGIQMVPRDGESVARDHREDPDTVFSEVAELIARYLDEPDTAPSGAEGPAPWPAPEKADITRVPITGAELFGRQSEIALLDHTWEQNHVRLLTLVAWGGTGKSTLVQRWVDQMAADNYRGAGHVWGWSFHNQGTTDQVCSADEFMTEALAWFGDRDPVGGWPWDRAHRLAELMGRRRTLLILDGLEPLQSALTEEYGEIADPALAAFLNDFARLGEGLCVITTRVPVAGVDADPGRICQVNLEHISAEAGRALMRVRNVRGTDAALEAATVAFGSQVLAVDLLTAYLRDTPGRDISNIRDMPDLDQPEAEGRHARRVIAAIEHRLGEGPEIELLRAMGLFDRPAEQGELAALRAEPAISGLTDFLSGLDDAEWLRLINALRELRLIAPPSRRSPDSLDTHPILREYFANRLRRLDPTAWLEGNLRLYQHLRDSSPQYPETLSEMMPLYRAVIHGCRAGCAEQALNEVFLDRILRGDQYFSNARLGAIGPNLSALSAFFDPPWSRTEEALSDAARRVVIREAGINLLSLGQLREAVDLFQASFDFCELREDWENGARELDHLTNLRLKLGRLDRALTMGKRCIRLAERSGSAFRRMRAHAVVANVLQHMGHSDEAGSHFDQARMIQRDAEPNFPCFISIWGYWFFDFLLWQGRYPEAADQAPKLHGWNTRSGTSLLAEAVKEIALGRLGLARDGGDAAEAAAHLEKAVALLKRARHHDVLPVALLALADRHESIGAIELASQAIDEAETIAARSHMRLFEADCLVARARLDLRRGRFDEAARRLGAARTICLATGYGRCKQQVDDLGREHGLAVT